MATLEAYARRNAGNEWAQRLSRMKAFEVVPGEPSLGGGRVVSVREWAPAVGEACLHVGAARRPRVVSVAAVDGRFARVLVDGVVGEWVLVADLHPVVGS